MRISFFIFIILLFLGGNYYVFYRAWTIIPTSNIARVFLITLAIILIGSLLLTFVAGEHLPISVTSVLYSIGTSWIFIFLYFLIFNLLMDLIRATRLVPKNTLSHYTQDNWLSFALMVGFIGLLMLCGYLKYRIKERVEIPIAINKELQKNDSLKIVAISDLHLGYNIGKKELQGWIRLINREEPDVVLIAGDILDSSIRPVIDEDLASDLREIKARYGVFAIMGNHDYMAGVEKSAKFMNEANIKVLRDETVLVDSTFYIVGRDDKTNSRRKSLEQLILSVDKTKPVILLDHQPYNLEEAEKNGIDFQFSGHTHRGQVWPISLITDAIYEDSYGSLKKGNTNIYVSSGIGIWGGKFRIGTQSEYAVINIKGIVK